MPTKVYLIYFALHFDNLSPNSIMCMSLCECSYSVTFRILLSHTDSVQKECSALRAVRLRSVTQPCTITSQLSWCERRSHQLHWPVMVQGWVVYRVKSAHCRRRSAWGGDAWDGDFSSSSERQSRKTIGASVQDGEDEAELPDGDLMNLGTHSEDVDVR